MYPAPSPPTAAKFPFTLPDMLNFIAGENENLAIPGFDSFKLKPHPLLNKIQKTLYPTGQRRTLVVHRMNRLPPIDHQVL